VWIFWYISGVLICVDFVGNHGTTEDEPGEGREDEPFRRGEKKTIKKV
jgi:hypothetical protein